MESLVRLTASDYEQAIDLLDLVFSQAGRPHHFERMLPRMCVPDDEHMGRHFAVKVGGRIVSMLGVYPLPVVIAGERFLFATTGNVATHHRHEGRGYAHALLDRAMRELIDIGADAARLGGFRQRYDRFGFEPAGTAYHFRIEKANVRALKVRTIRFEPVGIEQRDVLTALSQLQTRAPFYVDRGSPESFFLTETAWENSLFAAYDDGGRLLGGMSVTPDGSMCAELIARDASDGRDMVVSWIQNGRSPVLRVVLPAWDAQGVRGLSAFCQDYRVEAASQFRIMSWWRIADALCRVRSGLSPLPDGAFTLRVEGGPALRFSASGGDARCEETDASPDLTLDRLSAVRFLFGPQPPWTVAPAVGPLAPALLPLPLSWCGQDRV